MCISKVILIVCISSTQVLTLISERNKGTKYNGGQIDVLFILIDDMRLLKETEVKLNSLKFLSSNGIKFQNAFAQQALCAPSRNSILTGRRPDSLHLYDFYSYWRDDVANFTTLPQLFKKEGYDTYSVGKVFHPGRSSNFTDDFPYSWTVPAYHAPSEKYKNAKVCKDGTGKLHKNLICPVSVKDQPGKTLPDLEILKHATEILRSRNKTKPIFLAVGFHKPHIPLKFPREYLEKVPLGKVTPPTFPSIPPSMPPVAWQPWSDVRRRDDIKSLNISFPFGVMPSEWTLKIKQSYFAASMYVDDLVGKLLKQIDLRKTIVALTSDHGWSLGENGLWAKYSNFDVALKVPLLLLHPNFKPKTISSPIELLDIFPTLVELAGLKTNITKCTTKKDVNCFEGTSLMPLILSNSSSILKKFAVSQFPRPADSPRKNSDKPRLKDIKIMGYSIRTKRYRYTEWVSFNSTTFTRDWNKIFGIELYDHINDPEESLNVHLIVKYKHVCRKLSKMLRMQIEI